MALRMDRRVIPRRAAAPALRVQLLPSAVNARPCSPRPRRACSAHARRPRSCCVAATEIVSNSHITKSHFTRR
ncbi:hypothetical protein F7R13_21415 [Burkholderia territorii]|uniref:Uncharacterized protein n=1 Tax=Burkholderia territorii TaxID=1503055 RepID=A0A6L3NCB0_9BURK|nr:hypothetical protein F7R13_21415 [Burkholderia territorii]